MGKGKGSKELGGENTEKQKTGSKIRNLSKP
jgi:hypothetical protein